jgi:hypothetical protein
VQSADGCHRSQRRGCRDEFFVRLFILLLFLANKFEGRAQKLLSSHFLLTFPPRKKIAEKVVSNYCFFAAKKNRGNFEFTFSTYNFAAKKIAEKNSSRFLIFRREKNRGKK